MKQGSKIHHLRHPLSLTVTLSLAVSCSLRVFSWVHLRPHCRTLPFHLRAISAAVPQPLPSLPSLPSVSATPHPTHTSPHPHDLAPHPCFLFLPRRTDNYSHTTLTPSPVSASHPCIPFLPPFHLLAFPHLCLSLARFCPALDVADYVPASPGYN